MIILLLALSVLSFKFTIANYNDLNKPIFDLKSIISPRSNPFIDTANIARKYNNIGKYQHIFVLTIPFFMQLILHTILQNY